MFKVNRYLHNGKVIPIISTRDEGEATMAFFDETNQLAQLRVNDPLVKYSTTRIVLNHEGKTVMEMSRHYKT